MSDVAQHTRVSGRAREIRDRVEDLPSPGPWRECGADRGGCQCNVVWDTAADGPVAQMDKKDRNPYGEGFTEEAARKHAAFIAHARQDIPWLLDCLATLERQRDVLLEAAKKVRCHAQSGTQFHRWVDTAIAQVEGDA